MLVLDKKAKSMATLPGKVQRMVPSDITKVE